MIEQIINRFPGISCAYTDANGNIVTECYGVSDREMRSLVDENTIFPASSMSKFVTAILLMKLHEEKLIDIDAPVNDYLQQWKLRKPNDHESDATIRSIMCHTAGIQDGENGFYGLRRSTPEISLMDILEGKTFYNCRPVRAEEPQGSAFVYSDAGYCVLQLLIQEVTNQPLEEAAKEIIFDKLHLKNTFFASTKNLAYSENIRKMATGYDGAGIPIWGRFLPCPDLASSGLWSTPQEILAIAKAFLAAFNGTGDFLQEKSAHQIADPVAKFPWSGLGIFICDADTLMTQGWGENGQSMMKMKCRTGQISVVMTNRNPQMDQTQSGVEWLVDYHMVLDK